MSIRDDILELMHNPTQRDRQVKVGASNLSQPCPRCLAESLALMLAEEPPPPETSPYWLGSWIGTAVHERLERLITQLRPTWLSERKVVLGELEHYGVIKSTLDLYVPEAKRVVDFKTSTRAKLAVLKDALREEPTEFDTNKVRESRYKATSYLYQLMLYAWAMVKAGYPVETVVILFICRDGVGDKDVWAYETPYDQGLAEKAWDRLERLWTWLRDGGDPATLKSDAACWHCNFER